MNYKPVFQLGIFYEKRSGRESKLGGLPFGLPLDRWPSCEVCGRSQNYIGQFRSSDQTDLGRPGRMLFLFQCSDGPMCGSWDHRSGANAAVLLDDMQMTNSFTAPPTSVEVEPEGIIVGWEAVEPDFLTSYAGPSPSYSEGRPFFYQAKQGDRFLIQLIDVLDFKSPAPSPARTGAEHLHYWGGRYGQDNLRVEAPPHQRQHYGRWSRGQSNVPGRPSQIIIHENGEWRVNWANFGGGTAYVFLGEDNQTAFYFWEK